ncbi:MAG TPA: MFS transporter [bacterium]|nr:MFS transporter [bacterium]
MYVSDDAVTDAPVSTSRLSAFSPLRHRNFRLLWTGLVISNTGTWMQFVALGYLVDRLTQSPLYLGFLAATQAVPRLTFALVGGAAADRIDRRRLLLITNVVLMATALMLGLLTVTGRIQIWQILLIAAINSLVQSFDMPARHSMVPSLVEEREVLGAVSLNSVAFNGAGIFGPSIGGVVIAAVGEAGCFFVNAATYLSTISALLMMQVPRIEALGRARLAEDLKEGINLLRQHRSLLLFLATVAALSFFGRPYIRMMPAFAREVLHVDARGLGLLQSAPGIGTVCSALLVGWLSYGRGKGAVLGGAMLTFGFAVMLFGITRSFAFALPILVVMGLTQTLALASANTLVQLTTPPHARGRVMGLYSMVAFGGFAVGSLPVGAVADVIGVGPALSLGGMFVVLIALFVMPRLRGID